LPVLNQNSFRPFFMVVDCNVAAFRFSHSSGPEAGGAFAA
jgi:hypothetical protein